MKRDYTSIRLEVTSHCNLKCEYCHNAQYINQKDDLTTAEILMLIRNLKERYDIKKVLLTGGEPLTKTDICTIIYEISRMGIKADMVTNGTLITEEKLKELETAGLKRIRISIDEVDTRTDVRGDSNPNELWEKARMVVEKTNIELCVHTVCSPYNIKKLFDVYKKVLEIGAARWRVFDLGFQGDFVDKKQNFNLESYYYDLIQSTRKILQDYLANNRKDVLEMEINNIFRTAFLDMREEDYIEFDLTKELNSRLNFSPCDYIASHQLSIRSNGIATLCQYFHNPIFDYKQSGFDVSKALENRIPFEEDEITMGDLQYCSKCKYCMVCNSGCRSRALFLTGDIYDADPGACYLHQLVHKEIMSMLPNYVQSIYEGYINANGLEPKYNTENFKGFLKEKGYNA